ncbi:secretory pathway protein Sec39-domain-containing protein [Schizophyllum amplum]|uniref:Secretory pathway protein Sec39-domain-containing protein n=1 Tax=Schizophyllum amplum TaxID=97359 RepID=A0A550CNN4_9AGAR|nr:secretory pathway protein Sec39-domain-containing protein [Auriculariopsis ampla]
MTKPDAGTPAERWTALADQDITKDLIHELLDDISDDLWVAAACADRVVDDTDIQRVLLNTGLARTEGVLERVKGILSRVSHADDPEDEQREDALVTYLREEPTDARLCAIRRTLLRRQDRLQDYLDMCAEEPQEDEPQVEEELDDWEDDPWAEQEAESSTSGPSNSKPATSISFLPLSTFLLEPLNQSARLLALHCRFVALRILYEWNAENLWPQRFHVLDAIPEHVQPSDYRHLLPSFSLSDEAETMPEMKKRRPTVDVTEEPTVRKAVHATGIPNIFPECGLDAAPAFIQLTTGELAQWFRKRVDKIMTSTGMVDMALYTVQHGASQGIAGLDELGEDLSMFSRLVYDAPRADDWADEDDWTFEQWQTMQPPEVVAAFLKHSTSDTLARDISHLVMPYLYVLESRAERAGHPDPSIRTRLLYDYVLAAPLEKAAVLFEASKPTLPAHQRLVSNDQDIVRLALACLYGNSSIDQWSTMSRIFECMPAWDITRDTGGEDEADTTIASLGAFVKPTTSHATSSPAELFVFFKPLPVIALSRALDVLDVHLEGGEILSRWSVAAPLQWFLRSNSDAEEQRAWANRMARRAGGSNPISGVDDWEWLLQDMLKLAGKGDNGIRGAFGLLPRNEVKQIYLSGVLSSGEFYDNANSGNYTFGEMKLAYDCLSVPPISDRIQKQRDFIEATSRLSSYNIMSRPGIPITPIEIRLTKDRLSLVARVLATNEDAYRHPEVITELVRKLGLADDAVSEVKTLAMLADSAMQAEDFARATENAERMVRTVLDLPLPTQHAEAREARDVAWAACFTLGRQPEFPDIGKKTMLLGRSLELCPPDRLYDVLSAWRKLEAEDIDAREERLATRRSGAVANVQEARTVPHMLDPVASLRTRLQDFHMPSPPLLNTPDAAALASRTFKSVTANFPFSVSSRGRSQSSVGGDREDSRSRAGTDVGEVREQASRAFQRGIGWLIGADDE